MTELSAGDLRMLADALRTRPPRPVDAGRMLAELEDGVSRIERKRQASDARHAADRAAAYENYISEKQRFCVAHHDHSGDGVLDGGGPSLAIAAQFGLNTPRVRLF